MSVRRALACTAVLAATAALAGCSLTSDQSTDVPDSGPVAYYPNPAPGPGDALEGTLEQSGGCLVVRHGDRTSLPVFPVGEADWSGSALRYDGADYAAGDELALRGAVVEEGYFGPVTYIPADCERDETFFVEPLDAKR